MLIVPLHQRLTLARFPWITALLIVVNVIVHSGFQSRDETALDAAAEHYRGSGLVELEWPWLLKHLSSRGHEDIVAQVGNLGEPMRSRAATELQALDSEFAQRIRNAPFLEPGDERISGWRVDRAEFERRLALAFTPRYTLRYHQPEFGAYFTSMFLHGGSAHLLGNMVFLALLGLMTEAALGPWLFLGVYLLAGFGGGMLSAINHFGDFGSALGASGAIAGLMGACCVVWGMRKIRVFYWFFVIFDYVRVPALALLPVWLGWELWQMWSSPDAGIAFDAHAGGIITGALATFAIRKLGWERREVLDEATEAAPQKDLYAATRNALGKLDFPAARELSERLIRQFPNDREAWRLRMRAWRDRPQDDAWHDAARRLLLERLTPIASPDDEIALYDDYAAASRGRPRLSSDEVAALGTRWLQGHRLVAAERLALALLHADEPCESARRLALRLALAWQEAGDNGAFQRVAGALYQRCPNSAEAGRLQRLLGQD
jgi:membrane associated rhomboid family serine protease